MTVRQHQRRDPKQRDWREFLTSTERVEVEALEKNARDLDAKRKGLSHELLLHRSRCVQRRREAAERERRKGVAA